MGDQAWWHMQIILSKSQHPGGRRGPEVQALTGLYCEALVFESWSCDSVVVLPIPGTVKTNKRFKIQEKCSEWLRNIR